MGCCMDREKIIQFRTLSYLKEICKDMVYGRCDEWQGWETGPEFRIIFLFLRLLGLGRIIMPEI